MAQTVGRLPTLVDLLIYAGDDFYVDVDVWDLDGEPVDLTGYTPRAEIRQNTDSTVVEATFTATIAANIVKLSLTSADTTLLPTSAVWDVQVSDSLGIVTTLAYGRVKTSPEVTR